MKRKFLIDSELQEDSRLSKPRSHTMKSTVLALLPLAGIANAVHVHPRAKISSCASRQTVTATTTEKVYVTVSAPETPDASATGSPASTSCAASTIDVTSTRTVDITITVTLHPSSLAPYGNHSTSALDQRSSSSGVAYPTLSVLPTSKLEYSQAFSAVPQSEAPHPSASSSAAAVSTPAAGISAGVHYPVAGTSSSAPVASAPVAGASSAAMQYPPVAGSSSTPVASAAAAATPAAPSSSAAGSKKGEATFYTPDIAGGMCSFKGYTLPSGMFGTALSDSNWEGGAECGVCVSVTGPKGNKITAMVVDECPGCGPNHLDLFPDAFAKLEDPSKGIIPVSWDIVPCGITTPITLKNKEGTSKYWFAMQVMNSNMPISKLEVSIDGGVSWKPTTRKPYNFFEEAAGFGVDIVDIKVTSIDGKSIIVKDVSTVASSTKEAASNYSA